MNGHNTVAQHLINFSDTDTIASWSGRNASPQLTDSTMGSYHAQMISLFLLHLYAKNWIAPWFLASYGPRTGYCIFIQPIVAIVLHPDKTLLCPFPDVWWLHFVKFVPYANHAFSLDTNTAMPLWGTRTRVMTNKCNLTSAHAWQYICDDFKGLGE